NGTNSGEVFTVTPAAGTVTLSNYCVSGFTVAGNQMTCTTSSATGTIFTVNNTTPVTQYVITHNGTGSGSRIALLDCFVGLGCSGAPNSGVVQQSNNNTLCGGTVDLVLVGQTAGQGIVYQWQMNTGSGWVNFGTNVDNITTPAIIQNTQFRCQVTCTNSPGGVSNTAPVAVSVTPLTVDLGNDTTICVGATQTLDATSTVTGTTYLWNTLDTTPTIDITGQGNYY